MPTFSPMAAKPSARLHDVVDLPTPPLPEATAMTCLMPGMPAGLDVARALTSAMDIFVSRMISRGAPDARSSLVDWIVLARHAGAQIIFGGHHRRPWHGMRVETFVDHGFDATIFAHLHDIDAA